MLEFLQLIRFMDSEIADERTRTDSNFEKLLSVEKEDRATTQKNSEELLADIKEKRETTKKNFEELRSHIKAILLIVFVVIFTYVAIVENKTWPIGRSKIVEIEVEEMR